MNTMIKTLSAAAIALGLGLSAAAPGNAQDDQARPKHGDMQGRGPRGWGQPGEMRERMQARMRQRAQLVHDALALRADQETAWAGYIAEMKPPEPAQGPDAQSQREDRAALTTPERLDRMAARMSRRQAAFQRRADATRKFYAVLDANQRKTFDALTNLRFTSFGRDGAGFRRMR